jgi:putative protein-disulfide isomerase
MLSINTIYWWTYSFELQRPTDFFGVNRSFIPVLKQECARAVTFFCLEKNGYRLLVYQHMHVNLAMAITVIYCYDAYCTWCFGFSKVLQEITRKYKGYLDVEVLSAGMILPEHPVPISKTAGHLLEISREVTALTGTTFGNDYLWHLQNPLESDWFPNSEKPAIALCIFKEYHPHKQVEFSADLQYSLHVEGRDLCDDEAYRHLLPKYLIPDEEFYDKLHHEDYRNEAYQEFALVKRLKVTGYPSMLLQISPSKFQQLANGYTGFDVLSTRIDNLLAQPSIT